MYKSENPVFLNEIGIQTAPQLFGDHVEPLLEAQRRSLAREVVDGNQPNLKKLVDKFQEEFGERPPANIVSFFEALLHTKELLADVEQIRKNWQENTGK